MHPAKKFLGRVSRHFSLPQLFTITGKRLVLPFYHVASNERLPHVINLYQYPDVSAFEQAMDSLLRYFEPITLQQLFAGGNSPADVAKPSFHLSFDDGLRECAEVIAPILLRKGIPATFFLNSAFIDNRGLFYRYKVSIIIEHITQNEISRAELQAIRDLMPIGSKRLNNAKDVTALLLSLGYEHQFVINQIADIFELDFGTFLRQQKPYMTKAQVQRLVEQGFTLGAHSIDHPLYSKLELLEQLEQTKESLRYVQEVFRIPYQAFAFPFTDDGVGDDFFKEMYANGTKPLDITFGTAGLKNDTYPKHLQRIPMEGNKLDALQSIKAAYMASLVQQSLGLNRIKRR